MDPKKVRFDGKLDTLVDEQGAKYEGIRFGDPIIAKGRYEAEDTAREGVLGRLEFLAQNAGAEAYEIHSLEIIQEDSPHNLYNAYAAAILYRRG